MYPSQKIVLDKLFERLAAEGRGDALFGLPDLAPYEDAILACSFGEALPEYYFEFPLAGEPWLDMLALYDLDTLRKRGSFDGPDAYGYRELFRRFAEEGPVLKPKTNRSLCIGTELDLSRDGGRSAGFYVSGARRPLLVRKTMSLLGEGEDRIRAVLDVIGRIPSFWKPYYLGAMPGREGSPIRLGFSVLADDAQRYGGNAGMLAEHLGNLGFAEGPADALAFLGQAACLGLDWDVQVDVMGDGTLGSTLGVSFAVAQGGIDQARRSFAQGGMGDLMAMCQDRGLADDRWQRIPEAFFVDKMLYVEDERIRTLGLIGRANFAKVKWKAGVPETAKFYLAAKGFDAD